MLGWWVWLEAPVDDMNCNVKNIILVGHNIDCFECDSSHDPRCGDPFNYTLTIEDMPPLEKCQGCCVKLVQNVGTPAKKIRWDSPSCPASNSFLTIINLNMENTGFTLWNGPDSNSIFELWYVLVVDVYSTVLNFPVVKFLLYCILYCVYIGYQESKSDWGLCFIFSYN